MYITSSACGEVAVWVTLAGGWVDLFLSPGIDLHHTFLQYSQGAEFMLASQFYTLAWRAMLLEDSNNVDDFFK